VSEIYILQWIQICALENYFKLKIKTEDAILKVEHKLTLNMGRVKSNSNLCLSKDKGMTWPV
jgi:hypothetical protein